MERATGGIVLSTQRASAAVSVEAPTGFPLDQALAILGIAPNAFPLRIHGLPAGTYRVIVNGGVRTVALRHEVAELDL
jgi:hypothetical protein